MTTNRLTSFAEGRPSGPRRLPTQVLLFSLLLLLPSSSASSQVSKDLEDAALPAPRTGGAVTLNSNSNIWFNVILLAPILIAIILLDFAIFGAIADRADDLNPVSRFFFHVREGLSIVRHRQNKKIYNRHRYTRSANIAGPLLDSLAKAHQKYEEEED